MPTSRRALLTRAPLAAAVLAAPAAAFGAPDLSPAPPLHEALRARWAAVRERTAAGFAGISPGGPGLDAADPLGVVVDALAALDVVKELQQTTPVEQAAPGVQALWRDLLGAVGRGATAARAAAEAWLDAPGQAADPEGAHLHAVLLAMRAGVDDAPTTTERKQMISGSLDGLLVDAQGEGLRARVRRRARRLGRAERLATLLAADPAARRRHLHDDRRGEALRAAGYAPPRDDDPLADDDPPSRAAKVLGMLLLGVFIAVGVILGLLALCGIACAGAGEIVPMILVGVALLALVVAGIARGRHTSAATPLETSILVAGPGWAWSGIDADPDEALDLRAQGEVRGRSGWSAGPAGDQAAAGPGAALPFGPRGALVGRVGGEAAFLVGPALVVRSPRPGPLMLAVNLAPDDPVDGAFELVVRRVPPAVTRAPRAIEVLVDGAGWVASGLRIAPGDLVLLSATGSVRAGRAWPATPDGDGAAAGPTAPLPGAPHAALLARVGDALIFIGGSQLLPSDLDGNVDLAINLNAGEPMEGGFVVGLERLDRPLRPAPPSSIEPALA